MDRETAERLKNLEIEQGIEKGVNKWVRTVCVSSTMTFLGFCSWLANQIYDKFDAIQAGVRAFLDALRHHQ